MLGGLMAQQGSVRAVELPSLPELSESEVGPLIAGDWLTTVGPFLRDMSSSSSLWWDEVLNVAGALYRVWLNSEPMERLRLVPVAKDVPKVKKEAAEDTKIKDQAVKVGAASGLTAGEAAGTTFMPPSMPPSDDLVKEAVQLLKSLRPSVKMIGVRSINPVDGPTRALVDGGATHVLRPKSKQELRRPSPSRLSWPG